jgi:hypothetical protein
MRVVVVFILVAVIVLGGYFYLNPGNAPSWLSGLFGQTPPQVTTVYKWRDAKGNWQITDQPPTDGIPFDTLDYHRNENVVPLPPQLQPRD